MKIISSGYFDRAVKRLHANEKMILDKAVRDIMANTEVGALKTGDLAGIRVYKFRVNKNRMLLAYRHSPELDMLVLLEYGTHENFYREMKRHEH